MTFETDLFLVIKAAAPALVEASGKGRIYRDFASVSTPRPYCTFQGIGGQVINPLGNEVPTSRNSEMQISVWSNSRDEALAIIHAIEDAMRASSTFTARPLGAARWDFDADIPVYSAAQDFSCWHNA